MNNNFVELYGYKIFENGDILGLNNKKLKKHNAQDMIKVKIDNEYIYLPVMRFIYYAFNQDRFDINNYDYLITQIRKGDNIGINNLIKAPRKFFIQGEKSYNAKLTDKQIDEIISRYEEAQIKGVDKNNPNKKISYRSLAAEYGVSHSLISGIITKRFRNKDNYILK